MKTKRLLATVLSVVMLLSVFSVISLASGPYHPSLPQEGGRKSINQTGLKDDLAKGSTGV